VTGDYEPSALGWVREHVDQVVRTGTTDGITMKGSPVVLMTYRGAKTGKVRKTPVMRVEHQGRYAAVASKGGEPANPHWYASLVAEPLIELQDGTVTRQYRAREVSGDERALWWRRAVDAFPDFADYQRNIARQIPVFVLEPIQLTRKVLVVDRLVGGGPEVDQDRQPGRRGRSLGHEDRRHVLGRVVVPAGAVYAGPAVAPDRGGPGV